MGGISVERMAWIVIAVLNSVDSTGNLLLKARGRSNVVDYLGKLGST
jgi:hypothetical protein